MREAPFTARSPPGPGLQRALLTPSDQNFPIKAQTPGRDATLLPGGQLNNIYHLLGPRLP